MMKCSLGLAMAEYGLALPAHIEAGSKFHRFPGADKGPSNRAGWCRLFPDGRGAVFGDFSTGQQATWRSEEARQMDRAEWLRQVREAERQARAARQWGQRQATEKAVHIWSRANPAASHPYLTRKDIKAHGTRVDRHDNLVVPVWDGTKITSLQFIGVDGSKRFLSGGRIKGCWFRIGESASTILICEGFATGATLHLETGHCVVCAFSSGNLVEVAQTIHKRHQGEIIIAGDNDHANPANPGKAAAIKAAKTIGARWYIPDFTGLDAGPDDSDFNDLARLLAQREVVA